MKCLHIIIRLWNKQLQNSVSWIRKPITVNRLCHYFILSLAFEILSAAYFPAIFRSFLQSSHLTFLDSFHQRMVHIRIPLVQHVFLFLICLAPFCNSPNAPHWSECSSMKWKEAFSFLPSYSFRLITNLVSLGLEVPRSTVSTGLAVEDLWNKMLYREQSELKLYRLLPLRKRGIPKLTLENSGSGDCCCLSFVLLMFGVLSAVRTDIHNDSSTNSSACRWLGVFRGSLHTMHTQSTQTQESTQMLLV